MIGWWCWCNNGAELWTHKHLNKGAFLRGPELNSFLTHRSQWINFMLIIWQTCACMCVIPWAFHRRNVASAWCLSGVLLQASGWTEGVMTYEQNKCVRQGLVVIWPYNRRAWSLVRLVGFVLEGRLRPRKQTREIKCHESRGQFAHYLVHTLTGLQIQTRDR